jgi:hypothetical protein
MTFSFSALGRSRTFIVTVLLFVLANVWSWARHVISQVCCDQEITVGFPFPFHISGGIAGTAQFYVLGMLLDVVLALTVAVLATRISISLSKPRH